MADQAVAEINRRHVLGGSSFLLYQGAAVLLPPSPSQARTIGLVTLSSVAIVLVALSTCFPRQQERFYVVHSAPLMAITACALAHIVLNVFTRDEVRPIAIAALTVIAPPLMWISSYGVYGFSRWAERLLVLFSAAIYTAGQYLYPPASATPTSVLPPWTPLASCAACAALFFIGKAASFMLPREGLNNSLRGLNPWRGAAAAGGVDKMSLNMIRALFLARFLYSIVFDPDSILENSNQTGRTLRPGRAEILDTLTAGLVISFEYYVLAPRLGFNGRLPCSELAIAALWSSVGTGINVWDSYYKLGVLYIVAELATSLIILGGYYDSIFSNFYVPLTNAGPGSGGIPRRIFSKFRPRMYLFAVAQLGVNVYYNLSTPLESPSIFTFDRLSRLSSLAVGIVHIVVPRLGITRGAGCAAAASLRATMSIDIPKPPAELYQRGILPTETLEGVLHVFSTEGNTVGSQKLIMKLVLQAPTFNPPSRESPSSVGTTKVAALSYKHCGPFEGDQRWRAVKISTADLTTAIRELKAENFSHCWCDFAQGIRDPNRPDFGAADPPRTNNNGANARIETNWFEEGVAPYIMYEVIAVWDPSHEDTRRSLWIRLEELSGLIGIGIRYCDNNGSVREVRGLQVPFEQAVVQLGARAGMGELAECRNSYRKWVDDIQRRYGKLMASVHLIGGQVLREQIEDEADEVYHSQICVNALIKLPGRALKTLAVKDRKLRFPVGREWVRGGEAVELSPLFKRFPSIRILMTKPIGQGTSVRGTAIKLIVETISVDGIRFWSEAEGTQRSYGEVTVATNRWLGEESPDLEDFEPLQDVSKAVQSLLVQ